MQDPGLRRRPAVRQAPGTHDDPAAPSSDTGPRSSAAEMDAGEATRFLLGDWLVDVAARRLVRGDQSVSLEPRPMAVLTALCRQPGVVMSAETLLTTCWPGETLGDNPVHKVVAGLRKALDDSASAPRYIETIRKQGYRVVAPIGVLSAMGTRSHEGGWRGDSPFCGLEAFDEDHAAVFFGRDDAVASLQQRLAAQWRRRWPLVVLLGPSGSGKTSLVQAGLLPALRGQGVAARQAMPALQAGGLSICASASVDLATLGELDPWSALAGGLLDWEQDGQPLLSGHSISSLGHLLRDRPEEVIRLLDIALRAMEPVGASAASLAPPNGPRQPPLLVLDRLEAVLKGGGTDRIDRAAGGNSAPPADFIATLHALVASGRMVVLALCRNDFYPALAQHPTLMRDKEQGAHMDLAPPDAEALAQMIRLPARAAGLVFGSDASGLNRLDDRLSSDAMQAPDALPLLQYTLQALYLNRAPGDVLSWDAYEAMGRLEGAIGRHAEAVLAGLPPSRQEALGLLLPRIVSLSSEDASPTSRWAAAASLGDDDERALAEAFVDARLLVADHVAGATGFRVAHEALLRQWPRVTAWVAQHRATLALRDELRHWLQRWLSGGEAAPLLLPGGGLLWQASRALRESPSLFAADEQRFIGDSLRRLRLQRRLRWVGTALVALLAAVAVVAAIAYGRQARLAADRERQSQRLASFMLGDLADQLRPIGKLSLLTRIGEQGVRLLAPADGAGESPAESLQRAKALVVIGEVNSSRGKGRTDVALEALDAARRLLLDHPPTPEVDLADYYKTLGASAFWMGQMALDAGDGRSAMRWFDAYRQACVTWREALPEDATAQMEWGYAVNSLGSTAFQQADWAEAQRWFEQALKQKREALERQPDSRTIRASVGASEVWLAKVALVRGDPRSALVRLDTARNIHLELLRMDPDERSRDRQVAVIDLRRADAIRAMGREDVAVATMRAAVQRIEASVAQDPDNDYWRKELLHARLSLQLLLAEREPISAETLQSLRSSVQSLGGADSSFGKRDAQVRLQVVEVASAAARQQWSRVLELTAQAWPAFKRLDLDRPGHWQVQDLAGRLALLELQALHALQTRGAGAGTATRQDRCSALAAQLWPIVNSGQGGAPLEAWLLAKQCENPAHLYPEFSQRLVAGGYVPTQAALSSPSTSTIP
ncbi:nSTAND1 domain-containing NTPase [Roseateles terrae]|uniref:DNA-binding winged helix-turn-helix (WHTH) protein/tetratricopeptide (TPR) repeat protein n=1 Tax=Roseateles terrae TaxID=431060 RepID=A0ABR6GPU4_9BURK|nr:winged helix-turn-helix domain-containing protein [Roseateles terrae]MBB3193198.1 DNA-binding winged helix-turn-helix (wHTH) protein/tetratricopeptide (TPR) repeat protein [Roseateles terrae]